MQLEFDNGDQTQVFETELGKQRADKMMPGYDMKSVRIDTEKTVARIGVKMDQTGEGEIMGLRMEDAEGGFVVDEVWKEGEGTWAWQDV